MAIEKTQGLQVALDVQARTFIALGDFDPNLWLPPGGVAYTNQLVSLGTTAARIGNVPAGENVNQDVWLLIRTQSSGTFGLPAWRFTGV